MFNPFSLRIGEGYDVHRLVSGRKLILGGVEIDYNQGLLGHSDADVLLHAIMDALLGAASLGDIGRHFPDTDEEYRGISSLQLLEDTFRLITDRGFTIINLDSLIIAQKPKLSPFIPAMKNNICSCLSLEFGQVNIKATTTEGLGFEGRGEGIGARCVCLLCNRASIPLIKDESMGKWEKEKKELIDTLTLERIQREKDRAELELLRAEFRKKNYGGK